MISFQQATDIAKSHVPTGVIRQQAEYKNFWLFVIFTPDLYEGELDAIYSVNKETGEFRDFPYMDERYFSSVMELFGHKNNKEGGHHN